MYIYTDIYINLRKTEEEEGEEDETNDVNRCDDAV